MNSFSYCVPTNVIFGTDALSHLGAEIKAYDAKKVLVLYGSGSTVRTGVLGKVTSALDEAGICYVTKGGVVANPVLSFAYETIEFSIKEGVDFILAVGGGSVLDTAKGVAHGIANPEEDIWNYYLKLKTVPKSTPVGCVLTIAAAGSETSQSSVLTNEETLQKLGLPTQFNRPRFAIMNPEFTYTLPKYQVACGVVDIMMHTMDRYFAIDIDNETTDQLAEGILRTMVMYGKTGYDDPYNAKAMSEIMWCGSLSHNGLTGLGNTTDFAPHQLGHAFSAIYDSAHGASLACVWGGFAKYVYKENPSRFARYARNVWGVCEVDDDKAAMMGIEKTLEFFGSIGMPLSIPEIIGHVATDEEVDALALSCSFGKTRTIGSFKVLAHDDIQNIYESLR